MTPLVLLPGMMCDARLFAPQIAAFSGDRAVHIAPIGMADRVPEIAAHVLAQAPPRFALLGLSMGGIVAMEILAQAPDRVKGLALLDTNHLAEPKDRQALRKVQIKKVEDGGLMQIMRDEMKPHYLAEGTNQKEVLDLCMEMAEAIGPEVFVRQSRALAHRSDQTKTLAAVTVPSLVLCGKEDRLCPPSRHETMRDLIPGAQLHVIKGAGHLPVLEQPKATNTAIATWLDRLH